MPIFGVMSDSSTYVGAQTLSIGDVARIAGVTVPTVRNWDRDGKVRSFRTAGGQRRFRLSENPEIAQMLRTETDETVAS